MKKVASICAGLAMLALRGALFAQEAQSPAIASSASSPAQAADVPAIEEIVVTAQRRSENIQKVPIAITAASEETIQNLHIVSTAVRSAPAVRDW